MAAKTRFVCCQCGAVSPKWLGKCADCGAWNSFHEETAAKEVKPRNTNVQTPINLNLVEGLETLRTPTGLSELDLVLGGGIVKGSVILIGGEPGIGKSTIMLQIAGLLGSFKKKLLYVSGEESAEQIRMRADRLNIAKNNIDLITTGVFEEIQEALKRGYDLVVIDSIQTMLSGELTGAAGTIGQVRHVTYKLVEIAKSTGLTVFIIGQVTKEGAIAGPKVLEHLVDTVLYFEGDYTRGLRILRTVKNRFGSTNEVGLFEMTNRGLAETAGDLFVTKGLFSAGQAIVPVLEGSRSFLVEVQALVVPTFFQFPKRSSNGFDISRLQILIAVLEKRGGVNLNNADVYVNVAGGLRINETAADMAVCAAIISSLLDKALSQQTVFVGEVGLSGEIRAVSNMSMRLSEAVHFGTDEICAPGDINNTKIKHTRINNVKELINEKFT